MLRKWLPVIACMISTDVSPAGGLWLTTGWILGRFIHDLLATMLGTDRPSVSVVT